jgi:hypothetical protein
MTPTRIRLLAVLAVVAGAVGWGVLTLIEGQSGRVIPVPWLAPATLWFLAIAVLVWALTCRPRLLHRPGARPMPPFVAARTAALAMAASRTGSLVAGFYAGLAIGAFDSRQTPVGNTTLWASVLSTLGAVALVAAALWLEHMCRLPLDGDDDKGGRTTRGSVQPRPETGGSPARIGSST